MEWQEEDQSNDSSESELKSEMENSDDRDENDIVSMIIFPKLLLIQLIHVSCHRIQSVMN